MNLPHNLKGGGELCNFTANLTVGCTGMSVSFSGNPNWPTHEWDFGDGNGASGGSNLVQVNHNYQDINPYTTPVVARHRLEAPWEWCEQEITFPGIFIGGGCGTTRLISTLVSSGILPSGELNNRTLYVFGDLEVDMAYSFNTCSLRVIAGGKIIIKSGGKLTLTGGTVADNHTGNGGCDQLWTGIEVKLGGHLVTNGATIRDAYFAIRPILQTKRAFPLISLTNTTFTGNFIGICAMNGSFGIPVFSGNNFTGSGNTAILPVGTCNPPSTITGVPFTERTYTGIYFDGSGGGELVLPNGASANYFSNLQAGVVAVNGNATIVNCRFEDIAAINGNNAPHQGTAITFVDNRGARELHIEGLGKNGDFTVSDCERGIFATTSKGQTRTFIKNCRLENVQNGIVLTENAAGNFVEVEVEDNYVDCSNFIGIAQVTSTGIEINDPNPWRSIISILGNEIDVDQPLAFGVNSNDLLFPTGILVTALLPQIGASKNAMILNIDGNEIDMPAGYRGIHVSNVANAFINGNVIHNVMTNLETSIIGIEAEGGITNTIRCNEVTSEDLCVGLYGNSTVGFNFEANTTIDMHSGITIGNDNGTDCIVGSNTIVKEGNPWFVTVGLQYNKALTGPQILRGNAWDGVLGLGAGFYGGQSQFSYCDSRYLVSPSANIAGSTQNTVLVVGQTPACGDWFTVSEELDEDRHNCEQSPEGPEVLLNEADKSLAATGGTDSLAAGFQWSAKMGLYRKFTERPDLIENDTTIVNFLENQATESLEETYAVRNSFVSIYDNPSADSLLEDIRDAMNDTRTAMDGIQPDSTPTLWAAWSALGDELDSLDLLAIDALDGHLDQIEGDAVSTVSVNTTIECDAQPCSNEQFLHDLFLKTRIVYPRSPDSTEQAQLRAIAETCPGTGGPAVFQARAWYYQLTGETVRDTCSSPLPNGMVEERDQKHTRSFARPFTVQPNPAGSITRAIMPALENKATLCLRDTWGRIVWQTVVPKAQREVLIPVQSLASGFYTIVLCEDSSAPFAPAKLIVTH